MKYVTVPKLKFFHELNTALMLGAHVESSRITICFSFTFDDCKSATPC